MQLSIKINYIVGKNPFCPAGAVKKLFEFCSSLSFIKIALTYLKNTYFVPDLCVLFYS